MYMNTDVSEFGLMKVETSKTSMQHRWGGALYMMDVFANLGSHTVARAPSVIGCLW